MAKNNDKNQVRDPNSDDEYFLKELGQFIRRMRVAAGFPTIRSFVDTIDISYSQYQGYETGKNITIKVLKRIFLEFNLKVEDWLNLNIFKTKDNDPKLVDQMRSARVSHVMSQVISFDNKESSNVTNKVIQRYIDILINCHLPKNRSDITKFLEMDDSHNTFKRVAGKLIDYGWLDYTDKISKRSPEQSYVTTEKGKKALRLGTE